MTEGTRAHGQPGTGRSDRPRHPGEAGYAELCVTTNFTFLTGASHPEEMMTRAAELGLSAVAITDRNASRRAGS